MMPGVLCIFLSAVMHSLLTAARRVTSACQEVHNALQHVSLHSHAVVRPVSALQSMLIVPLQ